MVLSQPKGNIETLSSDVNGYRCWYGLSRVGPDCQFGVEVNKIVKLSVQ